MIVLFVKSFTNVIETKDLWRGYGDMNSYLQENKNNF